MNLSSFLQRLPAARVLRKTKDSLVGAKDSKDKATEAFWIDLLNPEPEEEQLVESTLNVNIPTEMNSTNLKPLAASSQKTAPSISLVGYYVLNPRFQLTLLSLSWLRKSNSLVFGIRIIMRPAFSGT